MIIKILLLLLIVFAVFFLFKLLKRKNGAELFNFLTTTLATLLGVLIAVSLTNYQEKLKETEDTVKLMKSAKRTLDLNYEYAKGTIQYLESQYKDSLNSEVKINRELINNSLPYPDLFEQIILSENSSKNISEASLFNMYNVLVNLRRLSGKNIERRTYLRELERLKTIMQLEIDYQSGNLSYSALEKKIQTIVKKDLQ
ncbi:hypothetical protein SAMN05421824_0019 [Hyunsoonleella jejuensis]|uniref:Uncharacterized protein n=1 Tax=Hyunsoonleella jejuensis TaxID=419940 RepID=A0A1H8ZSE4_9FLAO|nr:hypothetical protein [Hyunsoonleella jejuensis]SEP67207.1 hypothetical protein SAMN05421824_0019 [Hyunsoonleella jejuensis]